MKHRMTVFVAIALSLLLAGCLKSHSPLYKNDDSRALELFGEESIVVVSSPSDDWLIESKMTLTKLPGLKAAYETEDYTDIVFIEVPNRRPRNDDDTYILVQATQKTGTRTTFYSFVSEYESPNRYPGQNNVARRFFSAKKVKSNAQDGSDIRKVLSNFSRYVANHDVYRNAKYGRIYVFETDNRKDMRHLAALEEYNGIGGTDEGIQERQVVDQIRKQIQKTVLEDGLCATLGGAFKSASKIGGSGHGFDLYMEDDKCYQEDFLGVAYAFGIGQVRLGECNGDVCDFEADWTCQARGGSFVAECINQMNRNPRFVGSYVIENDSADVTELDANW